MDKHLERRCRDCGLLIREATDLQAHLVREHRRSYCKECRTHFPGTRTLKDHQAQQHRSLYCKKCEFLFDNEDDIEDHYIQNSVTHHFCKDCYIICRDEDALKQHYSKSFYHHLCETCGLLFRSAARLTEHCRYSDQHFFCHDCGENFGNKDGLVAHNTEHHWFCKPCNRLFFAESNLKSHLGSAIHNSRNYNCPALACNKGFLDEGDLIAHWETGTCPSTTIDRQHVSSAFVRADPSCSFLDHHSLKMGPSGKFKAPRVVSTQISEDAWTGQFWMCPKCPHKFLDRIALQAHLASAAHDIAIYYCSRESAGCDALFTTLSALVRHVTSTGSGRCRRSKEDLDQVLSRFRPELFKVRTPRKTTTQINGQERSPGPGVIHCTIGTVTVRGSGF